MNLVFQPEHHVAIEEESLGMKPLDRYLQHWRMAKARPYLAKGARVLDIGCADGELFQMFPEIEGVGIDPDLPEPAPTCPNVVFLRGMFPAVLSDDRPFDAITMLAVLEHIPLEHLAQMGRDCARYLKPGGHVVITVPSPYVDVILNVLRFLRLIHGMSLEQHYGFDPRHIPEIFPAHGLYLVASRKFQLGLNNLFVFQRPAFEQAPGLGHLESTNASNPTPASAS